MCLVYAFGTAPSLALTMCLVTLQACDCDFSLCFLYMGEVLCLVCDGCENDGVLS
jgi:hypothetical protein